jgi:FHA domain-containing protein
MIRIEVTGYNGKPIAQEIRADFDETGTIGRAPENTLVLFDLERKISRTHASLSRSANGYVLRDQGSVVPVLLNGQPLGNGREALIAPGDEIRIAGYVMSVRSTENGAEDAQAVADRSSDEPGTSVEPAAVEPQEKVVAAAETPLAAVERVAKPAEPVAKSVETVAMPVEPVAKSVEPVAKPVEPVAAIPMASGAVTAPREVEESAVRPAEPHSEVNAKDSLIPKSGSLAGARDEASSPASIEPVSAEPVSTDPVSTEPVSAEPETAMAEPVLSWTNAEGAGTVEAVTTIILSPLGQAFQESETTQADSSESLAERAKQAHEVTTDLSNVAAPGSEASSATTVSPNEVLARALLAGAGIRSIDIPGGLTPQLMNQLGRLLREATSGLLDLLAARAMTKREVRADMTVIVAKDNNPLKFSPDMEAALTHLLVPRGRGFMPPLRAVGDAYDDLRAHQLGFMAGMRSALAVVLARFDPRALEEKLAGTSVVDSILPTHRKAKLWDLFGELYGTISKDAQNDFHLLFGHEFLRAYQAHVAKLPERGESATKH